MRAPGYRITSSAAQDREYMKLALAGTSLRSRQRDQQLSDLVWCAPTLSCARASSSKCHLDTCPTFSSSQSSVATCPRGVHA
ncbi:hypothetical protein TIFTF001_028681 [Ficus carica]|uniref:Uncharacterized protein n=1 Tax=Ficus carica TaxID=3494 RepID=A0AA88DQW6_FICCA|nr:hypothetical protein TIFTF001_028681 [Ficus carica]